MADGERFHYFLTAADGGLEEKAARLREVVREHAKEHDFARQIFFDDITVGEREIEGARVRGVIVPMYRENIREFSSVNFYVKARAKELGLELVNIILPDGQCLM